MRRLAELDLAFLSGNWRGISGRIERALSEPGCIDGNWTPIIASLFGYSELFLERNHHILTCDPRRSLSWLNSSRAALQNGDTVEALRFAREGTEVAPGNWLYAYLIRSLLANGQVDEAHDLVNNRFQDELSILLARGVIAAYEGEQELANQLIEQIRIEDRTGTYWTLMASARFGLRDEANRLAAEIDKHDFGLVTLSQAVAWCDCGAPWDLEATPNFAGKLEESNLQWPPNATLNFPLKDW
jgi:hypothetical protein